MPSRSAGPWGCGRPKVSLSTPTPPCLAFPRCVHTVSPQSIMCAMRPLVVGEPQPCWPRDLFMTRIGKKTKCWGIWGLLQTLAQVSDYHSAFLGVFRIPSQAEAFCFYGALVPDPRAGVHTPLPNKLGFPTCTRACWGPKGHLSNPLLLEYLHGVKNLKLGLEP